MSTDVSEPTRVPQFVCNGRGTNPINNHVAADSYRNHECWALKRSSRTFFHDGIVTVSAAGERSEDPTTCKSFRDFFDILFDDLPRTFGPDDIYRLNSHVILLRCELASLIVAPGPIPACGSGFDDGSRASSDTPCATDLRSFGTRDDSTPLEPRKGAPFSYFFAMRKSKLEGKLNAAIVAKMVVTAERLVCLCSPAVADANAMCGEQSVPVSKKRQWQPLGREWTARGKRNAGELGRKTMQRNAHSSEPEGDYGRVQSFASSVGLR